MLSLFQRQITAILKGEGSFAATVQTLLSRVLIMATTILTGVITARYLGADGRGEQAAIVMWPQFLAYIVTFGVRSSLVYQWKKYPEKSQEYLSAALCLSVLMSALGCTIGVLGLPYWLHQYSSEVIFIAQCFMAFLPVVLISSIALAILEIKGRFSEANQLSQLSSFSILFLLCLFAFSGNLTPITGALSYTLPFIPNLILISRLAFRDYRFSYQSLVLRCKELLGYGLRSYGVDLLGLLSGQMDQIFIVSQLSSRAMGLYAVALSITRILNMTQFSLITVLFPKIAAKPVEEVVHHVGQAARLSAGVTTVFGLLIILVSAPLLQLLYGNDFAGTANIVRILVVEVLFGSTTWVLAQSFMALGKPEMVTVLQAVGLGINIPLMMILVPRYETVGAALALLTSAIIRLVLIQLSYPLVLKVKSPNLILTIDDFKYLQSKIN